MSPEEMIRPRRMLTLLDRIERDAEETERLARRVEEDYGWIYTLGLTPTAAGTDKVTIGGPSDPTGEVVSDERKTAARETARNVGVLVKEASDRAREAARIMRAAKRLLERRYGLPRGTPAPGAFPRTVTEQEVRESRAAQERRRARGERWGI